MRAGLVAALWLACAGIALAGELPPAAAPRPVRLSAVPAPVPVVEQAEPGFDFESAEARLAEKLAELERLHHEIDALRAEISWQSTVIAQVVLAEVDVDKLRRAQGRQSPADASKVALLLPGEAGQSRYCTVESDDFRKLIDSLRRDGMLKVLSEPRLVTVRNRQAQFDDGTTLVELTPTSIGNEVRFDLRVRHATPAELPPGQVVQARSRPSEYAKSPPAAACEPARGWY